MIESIENALQIAVLLACTFLAMIRAIRTRSKVWTLLTFFYGSWVLGDVYWLVCLVFLGHTPQISVVSDLSWYASYIFLYMLLREVAPPQSAKEKRFLPWLGYIFAAGMAVFFMQWGEIGGNLICAFLLGLLLFSAIRRLMDGKRYDMQRLLCVMILVLCLLEYALWTSSCFWKQETLSEPYYWFDILLTLCFPFFLPATKRGTAS